MWPVGSGRLLTSRDCCMEGEWIIIKEMEERASEWLGERGAERIDFFFYQWSWERKPRNTKLMLEGNHLLISL